MLRYTMAGIERDEEDLHVALNMSEQAFDLALPAIPGRRWHVALDTSCASPLDIRPAREQQPHVPPSYPSSPRSVVVLEARP
jgi:glycogen operon protein